VGGVGEDRRNHLLAAGIDAPVRIIEIRSRRFFEQSSMGAEIFGNPPHVLPDALVGIGPDAVVAPETGAEHVDDQVGAIALEKKGLEECGLEEIDPHEGPGIGAFPGLLHEPENAAVGIDVEHAEAGDLSVGHTPHHQRGLGS
jgi:hypothetical protein